MFDKAFLIKAAIVVVGVFAWAIADWLERRNRPPKKKHQPRGNEALWREQREAQK